MDSMMDRHRHAWKQACTGQKNSKWHRPGSQRIRQGRELW